MKKLIILTFFGIWIAPVIQAQSPDYEDLLTLFVGEKYEKCLYKADKYILDEATKKDALPYLFRSRCNLEMSKDEKLKVKYPDAFKNAIKDAAKFGQKDKEGTQRADYEDYLEELRGLVLADAELFMDQAKYTKAKGYYDYLVDIDNKDAGAFIMLGISHRALKAKKDSEIAFNAARTLLTEKKCDNMSKLQRGLLKDALMKVAANEKDAGDKAKAKEWMDLGLEYYKDDKEYMITYEEIIG